MRGILHREDFGWSAAPRFGGSQPAGNTTTTQVSTPWSGEQPSLQSIYDIAGGLYNSNTPQYYPNSTYATLTPTQEGLISHLIGSTAGGGSPALTGADAMLTNTESPAFTAAAQGTYNAVNPEIASIGSGSLLGATTPTFNSANSVLGNELSSSYLNPWNSPSFNQVVQNTEASVLPQISSSFINGGRTDSGLAAQAQAQGLTQAVGNLAQQQYNTNQNIQNQAAGQASANQNTNVGNTLQGASLGSSNLNTQTGQQNQAAFYAPFVSGQETNNMTTALNTAGMQQTDLQNQINADMARYNYNQMLPWNQLGLFEGAVTGTGNPGGTSTTSQPYFENPTANVMSGLTGIGSLALMGGMLFSDRNLKTDIEKVGEADSGFPLYSFRYKWESPMARHIGLMAQDVRKKRPNAVVYTPFGMAVDYEKALAA